VFPMWASAQNPSTLHIRKCPGRSLKTPSSERTVPLVGEALWAATKAVVDKDPGGLLFPTYGPLKANSASAALNKWIKEHCGSVPRPSPINSVDGAGAASAKGMAKGIPWRFWRSGCGR
jgi:hypothetical protein